MNTISRAVAALATVCAVAAVDTAAALWSVDGSLAVSSTTSTPPVLIYVPIHARENVSSIHALCDCTFDKQPSLVDTRFDVLLSISGEAPHAHADYLTDTLKTCVQRVSPQTRLLTHFTRLQQDTYEPLVTPDTKDDTWVAGPNTAFYDAFLDGAVYTEYVRHYELVQQMETDVCTLRPGWLDALLRPLLANNATLISGSSIASGCLYYAAFDFCAPTATLMESLQRHINGNALYRVGSQLEQLLDLTKALFQNREPFDVAIYEVVKLVGWQHVLFNNDAMFNAASLMDAAMLTNTWYYGANAPAAIHVPRRQRTNKWTAALTRSLVNDTVACVVWASNDHNLHLAKRLLHVNAFNRLHIVHDVDTYTRLSVVDPFRVVLVDGTDKGAYNADIQMGVRSLLAANRSVLLVDSNTLVRRSFVTDMAMLSLYGRGAVVAVEPSCHVSVAQNKVTLPVFISHKASKRDVDHALTKESRPHNCLSFPNGIVAIDNMAPRAFWSKRMQSRVRLVTLKDRDPASRAYRASFWGVDIDNRSRSHPHCSIFSKTVRPLTPANVLFELRLLGRFFAFVRDANASCIVHLGYRVGGSYARVPVHYVVNLRFLVQTFGLHNASWYSRMPRFKLSTTATYFLDTKHARTSHHRFPQTRNVCSHFGIDTLRCLPPTLQSSLERARASLPRPRMVCALDVSRSLTEVMRTISGGRLDAFVNAVQQKLGGPDALVLTESTIVMTGVWRVAADLLNDDGDRLRVPSYVSRVQSRMSKGLLRNSKTKPALHAWHDIMDVLLCTDALRHVYVSDVDP